MFKKKSGDEEKESNAIRASSERSFVFSQSKILIEGVLIRKHLFEGDGERAKNRKWMKMWCALRLSKENGMEFHQQKLSHTTTEFTNNESTTPVQFGDTKTFPTLVRQETSDMATDSFHNNHLSIGDQFNSLDVQTKHLVLSSPTHDYKLSSHQEPDVFSLIHSFANVYLYGPARPNCFAHYLPDNSTYLYQAPTSSATTAWIQTINYWAARKSREPMRGGLSNNTEYGWNILAEIIPKNEQSERDSLSSNSNSIHKLSRLKLKVQKWTEPTTSDRLISTRSEVSPY